MPLGRHRVPLLRWEVCCTFHSRYREIKLTILSIGYSNVENIEDSTLAFDYTAHWSADDEFSRRTKMLRCIDHCTVEPISPYVRTLWHEDAWFSSTIFKTMNWIYWVDVGRRFNHIIIVDAIYFTVMMLVYTRWVPFCHRGRISGSLTAFSDIQITRWCFLFHLDFITWRKNLQKLTIV